MGSISEGEPATEAARGMGKIKGALVTGNLSSTFITDNYVESHYNDTLTRCAAS